MESATCSHRFIPLSAGILGLALVLSTALGGVYFYKARSLANAISVTGSAEKLITSDTVKWTAYFTRTVSFDALDEGSKQMKRDLDVVRAYLDDNGISAEDVTVLPVSMQSTCTSDNYGGNSYDQFGRQICGPDRVTGYSFSQSVIVESNKVSDVNALIPKAVDYYISKGLFFNSQNTEYYYSHLADVRLELIAEATVNAQERANRIAESTDSKVKKLQSASMGVFQITPENSADFSDYGYYDTTSINKKVTGVVRASFLLK